MRNFNIFVLMFVFIVSGIISGCGSKNYEYKEVVFSTQGPDRTGSDALRISTIDLKIDKLNVLGNEGWEISTSYLEMETSFPNFGDSSYVTGLQPNVRPQRLIVILKREIPFYKMFNK